MEFYQGEFQNDQFHGLGIDLWENHDHGEAEYDNGLPTGYSVKYQSDKITRAVNYEGQSHGLVKIQYKDKPDSIEYWLSESGD